MFTKSIIAAAFAAAAVLPFNVGAASIGAGVGANVGAGSGSAAVGADAAVNGAANAPNTSGSANVGSAIRMEKLDSSTSTNADIGQSMERQLKCSWYNYEG